MIKALLVGLKEIPNVMMYGSEKIEDRALVVSFNIENKGSREFAFMLDRKYNVAMRSGLDCAPLAHETIGTASSSRGRFDKEEIN